MTDCEIMRQALDALEDAQKHLVFKYYAEPYTYQKAIDALRQALAQPEQDYIKKLEDDFCEQLDQLSERNYKLRMELADAKLAQPEQDRESDRKRFPDEAFNRWLDEGISDSGHTVWDTVGDISSAWQAWSTRPFYDKAVEQEPIAWLVSDAQGRYATIRDPAPYGEEVYEPLYAAPPKRPWQGLTDEEVDECNKLGLRDDVYKAIEQKLKDLNT